MEWNVLSVLLCVLCGKIGCCCSFVVGWFAEDEILTDLIKKIDSLVDKVEDWSRLSAEPRVSVVMTTYNHEKFVAQALDGILMQEVDFPYEIVLGEDCSTDRTREIVCEYQRRHPDKIRLRLARENLYSQKLKPGIGVLHACRGKYIALCEGDDYWTDPLKLQKQVDLLESEPEISACFTNAAVENDNGDPQPSVFLGKKPIGYWDANPGTYISQVDLIRSFCVPTCTLVYRSEYTKKLPEWFFRMPVGDWPLCIVLSEHGLLKYINEISAVYRKHDQGVFTRLSQWEKYRQKIDLYSLYLPYAPAALCPILESIHSSDVHGWRRYTVGTLMERFGKKNGDHEPPTEKEITEYFGRKEYRRIRMDAWEQYFQSAYFTGDKSKARHRLLGLLMHHPEWLVRRGSLGQIVRTLAGRIP